MSLARLLVVEDDNYARLAISSLLVSAGFEVRAAGSAKEALSEIQQFNPEVCLLDIDLGIGPTGVDVAIEIRSQFPRMGIVFLTSFFDVRVSRSPTGALPLGARWVTKQALENIGDLAKVLLSAKHFPLANTEQSSQRLPLSDNQIELIRLVGIGHTNQEIALLLGVSEKAVENSITRLIGKLKLAKQDGLNPRVQLVHLYASLAGKPIPK